MIVFAQDFLVLASKAKEFAQGVYTDILDRSEFRSLTPPGLKKTSKKGPVAQVVRAHA